MSYVLPTRVLPDTGTPLAEDTFRMREVADVSGFNLHCGSCDEWISEVDDGDDLNSLIRLAYQHSLTKTHRELEANRLEDK